jgi:ABC-type transport system involved in cytochrome bd biosynthesis fused ATPase/permease subunit
VASYRYRDFVVPLAVVAALFAVPLAVFEPIYALIALYMAALAGLILVLMCRWIHDVSAEKERLRKAAEYYERVGAQLGAVESALQCQRERLRADSANERRRAEEELAALKARLSAEHEQVMSKRDAHWFREGVLAQRRGDFRLAPPADLIHLDQRRRPHHPPTGTRS